eukprot:scaffold14576_cov132-Isochrysis_galbana.AAC.16
MLNPGSESTGQERKSSMSQPSTAAGTFVRRPMSRTQYLQFPASELDSPTRPPTSRKLHVLEYSRCTWKRLRSS